MYTVDPKSDGMVSGFGAQQRIVIKGALMPQMGNKAIPGQKMVSPAKGGGGPKAPAKEEDLYNISNLNQQILDEGEDAGGAIMKKLYRIHSRSVLETNENLNIDISG